MQKNYSIILAGSFCLGIMFLLMTGCDLSGNSQSGQTSVPSATPTITVSVTPTVTITATPTTTPNLPAVENPAFSPVAGVYTSPQSITISTTTEGADIFYTTDGSTPTTSSLQYSGAIDLNSYKQIRAIAVKTGMDNSEEISAEYEINSICYSSRLIKQDYTLMPIGIWIDAQDNVYVTIYDPNKGDRVEKYNSAGIKVMQFGGSGTGNGQFNGINGITVAADGTIYVVDQYNYRVEIFKSDGTFSGKFGSKGTANGEFGFTEYAFYIGIATDSKGNVYVCDIDNQKVQKFDAQGQYLNQIVHPKDSGKSFVPFNIYIDAQDVLYILDGGSFDNAILKYDTNGNFLGCLGRYGDGQPDIFRVTNPRGLCLDAAGNIYITSMYYSMFKKYDANGHFLERFGTPGSGDGQFSYPFGIAVNSKGYIYVADCNRHDVQIFK